MNKGQNQEKNVKNLLKLFKMNEDKFSTILGIIVVFLVGMMVVNYFKSVKLNVFKGSIFDQAATTTEEKQTVDVSNQKKDIYKVVKGDDLWHIAEKYYKSGYNYVDIIKENKLDKTGRIEPGMELKMPNVEAKKVTVMKLAKKLDLKTVEHLDKDKEAIDFDAYTTQRGDSLWSISVRAYGDGYQWSKIYKENKLIIGKNPSKLYVGIKIRIPKKEV